VERLGIKAGSPAYRAVSAGMRALAVGDLPGPDDFATAFAPTHAHTRRLTGFNVWLLYRFDDRHVLANLGPSLSLLYVADCFLGGYYLCPAKHFEALTLPPRVARALTK